MNKPGVNKSRVHFSFLSTCWGSRFPGRCCQRQCCQRLDKPHLLKTLSIRTSTRSGNWNSHPSESGQLTIVYNYNPVTYIYHNIYIHIHTSPVCDCRSPEVSIYDIYIYLFIYLHAVNNVYIYNPYNHYTPS